MVDRNRQIQIDGLKELKKMVKQVSPRVANQIARAAVHGVAIRIRNAMRQRAPKDDGVLRKAIVTVRRRGKSDKPTSDVRITQGKNVKNDAWYWHFVEYGTVKHESQPFIVPTVEEFTPKIPRILREEFAQKLEKRLARDAKRLGKTK